MRHRRKGGDIQPFPSKYYDPMASTPAAAPGRDLLHASGLGIRPSIGCHRGGTRKNKGGFTPSVMGSFPYYASKYVVPVALYSGYKMLTKQKSKKGGKRHSKRRTRHSRR
jgi:hypothetical protein